MNLKAPSTQSDHSQNLYYCNGGAEWMRNPLVQLGKKKKIMLHSCVIFVYEKQNLI